MITTAPDTIARPTVQGGTFKANRTPIPHDMSCAHCNHGLHVHLACGRRVPVRSAGHARHRRMTHHAPRLDRDH